MKALDFLHSEAITTLLENAAEAGGVPLSIHFVQGIQESSHVLGCGGCAACSLVNETAGGPRFCRQSRVMNAAMALRQQRCIPWICPMGFSCVSMPLLEEAGFVMTLGPYCPAEASEALEADAASGWADLTEETGATLPVSLKDIHRCPASAPPALARWVALLVAERWQALAVDTPEDAQPEAVPEKATWRFASKQRGLPTAEIAAALMGGNQHQARQLIQGALEEAHTHSRISLSLRRARILAITMGTLEALERAGAMMDGHWEGLSTFAQQVGKTRSDAALVDSAVSFLAVVKRQADKKTRQAQTQDAAQEDEWARVMSALNQLVTTRLYEGVTLEEVAAQAGKEASSISHYLKLHFKMTFLEYFGRLRVDEAKRLLRETRLTASDIAHRVGISDLSNFRRTFKRFEGMTPSDYKKRHGKK